MKGPAFVIASAVLVSLVAVSQSGVISELQDEVAPYSIIDPIIKAILEGMRPKLANIRFGDVNETVKESNLQATIVIRNILIENADKFVIKSLKSNMVPLKLTNLTLTWNNVTASAEYDVNANLTIPQNKKPINLFGKGAAKATLKGLYFTVGANMEMKGKAIQIKPKGLFGFDVSINSTNVTFTSLMGSPELGKAVGVFVSKVVPDMVNILKAPMFNAFQDDIINIVNQILKKNGTTFADDEFESPELSFESLDLSEEINSFFNRPFEFGSDETQFETEF